MIKLVASNAQPFLERLTKLVSLFLIDPPYYGIVDDSWDNQWKTPREYLDWMFLHLALARKKAAPNGSLLCFQGIGRPGEPWVIDELRSIATSAGWHYRNWITWKKRRAYGKSHDYLFCREEIFWFTVSKERTACTFNIPLLDVKRGYAGWSDRYPAKSEFKRVSNVWDDIPELMRPERTCQKPERLIERLIATHSNPGDLVCDFFAGYGTTGMVAKKMGRHFTGCEAIAADAKAASARMAAVRVGDAVK